MKVTIWKYLLTPDGAIEMPLGAIVLSAGIQGDDIFIWAIVNPSETKRVIKRFITPGTGMEWENTSARFINTVFLGRLVFHIFEVL